MAIFKDYKRSRQSVSKPVRDRKLSRAQSALPGRGGLARIMAAFWNSLGGLQEGLSTESAIKQEAAIACLLLPFTFFIARDLWTWVARGQPALRAVDRVSQHRNRTAVQSHPSGPPRSDPHHQGSRIGRGILRAGARRIGVDRSAAGEVRFTNRGMGIKRRSATIHSARGEPQRPHLPHATLGPFRLFASDPGWSEAWWWLGIPLFIAIFVIVSYRVSQNARLTGQWRSPPPRGGRQCLSPCGPKW